MRRSQAMPLRITKKLEGPDTILQIDGRLHRENNAELGRACESIEGHLTLELSGLLSADTEGIRNLRQLESHGARFRGASPYIQLLLKNE